MQKTKLGISVGVFGALLYFSGLFSGYLLTTLLAGYVLFKEENPWLKKTAVKSIALMIGFSVLYAVVGLLPDTIDIINNIFNIFNGYFSLSIISQVSSLLLKVIGFAETIVFVVLGFKSISQGTVPVPVIDSFVNKNIQ